MKLENYIDRFKEGLKKISAYEKEKSNLSFSAILEKFISLNVAKGRILYTDTKEISNWFIKELNNLQAKKRNPNIFKKEEKLLYYQLYLKIKNAKTKKISKILVGKKTGEKNLYKPPLKEIDNLSEFYFVEKNEKDETKFYKRNDLKTKNNDGWLVEISEIPGVNIVSRKKNSGAKSKTNKIGEIKKEADKEAVNDFINAFGGSKESNGEENNSVDEYKIDGRVYLATISPESARIQKLPQITQNGEIIKNSFLYKQAEKDIEEIKMLGGKLDDKKMLYYVPEGESYKKFKRWLPREVENRIYGEVTAKDIDNVKAKIASDMYIKGFKVAAKDIIFKESWTSVPLIGKENKKQGGYKITSRGDSFEVELKAFSGDEETQKYEVKTYKIESREKQNKFNNTVRKVRELYQRAINRAIEETSKSTKKYVSIEAMEEQIKHAEIAENIYKKALPPDAYHPYLVEKGMQGMTYTFKSPRVADKNRGKALMIPMYDVNGKIWSIQNIYEREHKYKKNGETKVVSRKQFGIGPELGEDGEWKQRQTRTSGTFYILSNKTESIKTLKNPIIIAEGIATGMEIQRELNYPVVVAFFKDNLRNVIGEILLKYPDRKFVIFADNDLKGDIKNPNPNYGLIYANKAKESFKEGIVEVVELELTDEERSKGGCTDWNDLFLYHKDNIDIAKKRMEDAMKKVGIDKNNISKEEVEIKQSEDFSVDITSEEGTVSPP